MSAKENTRLKILMGTLKILGEEDVRSITVRRIAQETGVNIALIQYHFGSKEKLIEESLSYFGNKMSGMIDATNITEDDPAGQLGNFIFSFVKQLTTFPGFTRSIMFRFMKGQKVPAKAYENIEKSRINLFNILKRLKPELSDEIIQLQVFQMMSSIMYPILLDKGIKTFMGSDLKNDKDWKEYTKVLLKTYL
ncbi:MAG: TetR/AcrR family transcriptional regulator [Spirochaetaceae bacterium]|jgi:AcrR family transcriptional regulator|nr:TetR/AcrR family transcriptional regulator [Spirochaetaceae bacterium]